MSNKEAEVGEWILKHGETIVRSVKARINQNYKLLPDFLYEIFLDSYSDEVLKVLRESTMESLNFNPDDLDLFFTKNWVKMLLGKEIFNPGEKNGKV